MSGQTMDGKPWPRASNRGWQSELQALAGRLCGNLMVTTGMLMRVGKQQRAGLEVQCMGCGQRSIKAYAELKRGRSGCKRCGRLSGVPNWLLMRCRSARKRCENPHDEFYKDYGARGIQFRFVSPTAMGLWIMENLGLHRELTLDRKENGGHYEPGNLRWASQTEQANNRRPRRRGYHRRKSTTSLTQALATASLPMG